MLLYLSSMSLVWVGQGEMTDVVLRSMECKHGKIIASAESSPSYINPNVDQERRPIWSQPRTPIFLLDKMCAEGFVVSVSYKLVLLSHDFLVVECLSQCKWHRSLTFPKTIEGNQSPATIISTTNIVKLDTTYTMPHGSSQHVGRQV